MLVDDRDKCPRCNCVGAVVDEDALLGLIYECFYCTDSAGMANEDGRISELLIPVKWAMANGGKAEVIG